MTDRISKFAAPQAHTWATVCPTVKENDSNVGREIYNLLSNVLLLWAMLSHDAMERLVSVLGSTSQASLTSQSVERRSSEVWWPQTGMRSGMMSWWMYWYIRLFTSLFLRLRSTDQDGQCLSPVAWLAITPLPSTLETSNFHQKASMYQETRKLNFKRFNRNFNVSVLTPYSGSTMGLKANFETWRAFSGKRHKFWKGCLKRWKLPQLLLKTGLARDILQLWRQVEFVE